MFRNKTLNATKKLMSSLSPYIPPCLFRNVTTSNVFFVSKIKIKKNPQRLAKIVPNYYSCFAEKDGEFFVRLSTLHDTDDVFAVTN